MEDELAAQLRDISGTTYATCDRCGRPISPSIPDGDALLGAQGPDAERVCTECRRVIGLGIEPVEFGDPMHDM